MKYIITESRLDDMIHKFITNLTGGQLIRHKHPSAMVNYIWWTDLGGRTIFEADDDDKGLSLGVREDIWNLVNRLFSINNYDTDKAFMTWMENYNGMKFPSGVYTFEMEFNLQENIIRIMEMMGISGEDIILYHGGDNLNGKKIKFPIFLTPDKNIVEWYAHERGGWVNEFSMGIKKSLDNFSDWKDILEDIGINPNEFNDDMVWKLNNKKDYGGGIMDMIYYKPFRDAVIGRGYDVIIGEDSGNQETTGIVYLPLDNSSLRFIKSYRV